MSSLAAEMIDAGLALPVPEAHRQPPFSSVAEGVAAIGSEGPAQLSSDRLRDDLRWMAAQQRAIEAMQARWLAELDRRDGPQPHESSTLFLPDHPHPTANPAHPPAPTARQLEHLPPPAPPRPPPP